MTVLITMVGMLGDGEKSYVQIYIKVRLWYIEGKWEDLSKMLGFWWERAHKKRCL